MTGAGEAARRWRTLVRARRAEIERLDPGRSGPTDGGYWDRRADRFAACLSDPLTGDAFLARLRRLTGSRTTVIDVGSGPGRFALALAPRVAGVVAVDPSRAMLDLLREQARRRGLANVAVAAGRWDEVDVEPADVVFASYVLPVVADAPAFLAKMDATARRHALLYLGAFTNDAIVDPLWRHFHGRPRRPGPTWLDVADVLREMGIDAKVEIVEVPNRARFASLGEAVDDYRDLLALPDTTETREELRRLLRSWLVGPAHALRTPVATLPAAVVRWRPTGPRPSGG
ncbi:MAG: class I SAM-dependent methyltransferase [Acidimicrobiales bacterium]